MLRTFEIESALGRRDQPHDGVGGHPSLFWKLNPLVLVDLYLGVIDPGQARTDKCARLHRESFFDSMEGKEKPKNDDEKPGNDPSN